MRRRRAGTAVGGAWISLFLFCFFLGQIAGSASAAPNTGLRSEADSPLSLEGSVSAGLSDPFVTRGGNLYFLDDRNSASLVLGKAKAKRIVIPAEIRVKGSYYRVERIAPGAFAGHRRLEKVLGGNNVTAIGKRAFRGCDRLQIVRDFGGLVSIDQGAFMGCRKLKEFDVGAKLTLIGEKAFAGCSSLKSLCLGSLLSGIGRKAFLGCKSLTELEIASVYLAYDKVGEKAFKGIPASCRVIVPAERLLLYKSLFRSRGLSSKVRFKKR